MANKLWAAATSNAFNTTLNGSIGSGDSTITLNNVSSLQVPGVVVLDRTDGAGNSTPTTREYVTYTGINSNQLTGCTRGLGGSTAQSHNSGAQVEEVMSITHWNDMVSFLQQEHDVSGHHVIGTATINYTETKNLAVTSIASIAQLSINTLGLASLASIQQLYITNLLNASGASLQAFPINPVWVVKGSISGASVSAGAPLPMPRNASFQYVSAVVRVAISQASLVLDFKKNFSSIINSSNVLSILAGGTFVSTASITTPGFVAGDIMSVDIANGGGSSASDLTVMAQAR